ncbi:MAG: hypothetical protein HZC17_01760 [Candidatus Omnitrophica bacterium]|nr:hypothetical protein [Candidatus Omnitrophota bacterium]
MTSNFAYSKGEKYFYYKCVKVNKFGKEACPVKSAPAKELEALIVKRLSFLGENKKLVEKIVKEAQESSVKAFGPLREDRKRAQEEIRKVDEAAKKLILALGSSKNRFVLEKLDELEATKQKAEERLAEINLTVQKLEGQVIDAEIIRKNLKQFEAAFEKLTLNERKDLLRLLIKEVIYDQTQSKIKLTLRPLPDLGFVIEDGKVSFDERQEWLPGQDSNLGQAR